MALLLVKKVTIPAEYVNFADMFSEESAYLFLEQTGVNEHALKLEDGKQPPYGPIYSLGVVELKTLKTYIETNLANGFIKALNHQRMLRFCLYKSPIVAFACVLITEVSIISQSKIGICCRWLVSV